jgi:hypothetical protein
VQQQREFKLGCQRKLARTNAEELGLWSTCPTKLRDLQKGPAAKITAVMRFSSEDSKDLLTPKRSAEKLIPPPRVPELIAQGDMMARQRQRPCTLRMRFTEPYNQEFVHVEDTDYLC